MRVTTSQCASDLYSKIAMNLPAGIPRSEAQRNAAVFAQRMKLNYAWVQGRVSNFEYLSLLNRFSGRSFHDITQYPVFPWILNEYATAEYDVKWAR